MDNNSQNSDVEIRTMKSDIEAIKAGGGDIALMSNQEKTAQGEVELSPFKTIIFFAVIILAVAGIGFLAYYLASKMIK
ncbi:hypothetical protein HZB04_00385 [Candidatus Wolfebacteria bacterium]|nr:hypothetical protein [Candidatus Wolfebacteria bacterium]